IGNATPARRLEIVEQRIQPRECLWRARFVSASNQGFDRVVGKLREVSLAVGRAIQGKCVAHCRYGTQTLRADDLVDEYEMIFLDGREIDSLVQFFGQSFKQRPCERDEIAANGCGEPENRRAEPYTTI